MCVHARRRELICLRAAAASYAKNRARFALSPDNYLLCESAAPHAQRMYVGPWETPSLAELRERLQAGAGTTRAAAGERGLRFQHLADPVGVQSLIADPQNADAVFQAASQFNCLEMVGPGVSPRRGIAIYVDDPTQGPKCALACPAGTVYRNYLCGKHFAGQGDVQIDCLADVGSVVGNTNECIWKMQNGYCLPTTPAAMRELNQASSPTAASFVHAGTVRDGAASARHVQTQLTRRATSKWTQRLKNDPQLYQAAAAALRVGVHWDTSVFLPQSRLCFRPPCCAFISSFISLCSSLVVPSFHCSSRCSVFNSPLRFALFLFFLFAVHS